MSRSYLYHPEVQKQAAFGIKTFLGKEPCGKLKGRRCSFLGEKLQRSLPFKSRALSHRSMSDEIE